MPTFVYGGSGGSKINGTKALRVALSNISKGDFVKKADDVLIKVSETSLGKNFYQAVQVKVNATKTLLIYGGNNNQTYCRYITKNGNDLVFNEEVQLSTSNLTTIKAVRLSDTFVVLICQLDSIIIHLMAINISGSKPVLASNYRLATEYFDGCGIDRLSDTKFIISYRKNNNSACCRVVEFNNGFVLGSEFVFTSSNVYQSEVTVLTNNHLTISYIDINNVGMIILCSVTGNTISFLTSSVKLVEGINTIKAKKLADGKGLVCYSSGNEGIFLAYELTNNRVITLGNKFKYSSNTSYNEGIDIVRSDKVVMFYSHLSGKLQACVFLIKNIYSMDLKSYSYETSNGNICLPTVVDSEHIITVNRSSTSGMATLYRTPYYVTKALNGDEAVGISNKNASVEQSVEIIIP